MPPKQERILKIINELESYLVKLAEAKKYSLNQFKTNWNIYFSVERLIQLSIECVIEIGEDVISLAKYKKPDSYRETFEILAQEKVISQLIAGKLMRLVEFRNKLVHAYSTVPLERIYKIYTSEIGVSEAFIKVIKRFLV